MKKTSNNFSSLREFTGQAAQNINMTERLFIIDWNGLLEKQGYASANLSGDHHWPEVHDWCRKQFGADHYTWTGSRFWFETQEAALLFVLKWQQ